MPSPLQPYRQELLTRLLRGILPLWFVALAAGLLNLHQALQRFNHPILVESVFRTAFLYLALTALVVFLALAERLPYFWRATAFLLTLYLIALLGLAQAAFFGDGRVLLFAFIVFSSIFFDRRGGILALTLAALTLITIGLLYTLGILYLPPGLEQNPHDPKAWFSGTSVLLTLGLGAWVSVHYLIRRLEKEWQERERARQYEEFMQRLVTTISAVHQKIIRANRIPALLEQVSQELASFREYSLIWIGLLERDGRSLRSMASFALHAAEKDAFPPFFQAGTPSCIAQALEQGAALIIEQAEQCVECPLSDKCPRRKALILPLSREGWKWGVLYLSKHDRLFSPEEKRLLEDLADNLAYALGKIRGEEQAEALAAFASQSLMMHTLDELWNGVIHAVHEILDADRVAIYTYDREKDQLSCLRYSGLSTEYVEMVNRHFRQLPGSRVLRSPQPIIVNDILKEKALPLREEMLREGFRSYAVFPILSASGVSAAFVAYRNAPLPFTPHEIYIGQGLTNFIAQAFENLNLYERLRTQAAELGRLYAVAQDMAASLLDPSALLNILAEHMLHALDATGCVIFVLNESRSMLNLVAESWDEHLVEKSHSPAIRENISLQDFPNVLRVIQSGMPIALERESPLLSPAEREAFEKYGAQSMLVVPILVRGRMLGIVEIWERRVRQFTQAEIRLAQAMAGFGTIIESAQLFQELERREAFFRAVIEHAADGIAILDEEGSFRYLSPSTERLLGYPLEEITNRSPFDYIHPDDLPLMQQAWEEGLHQAGIVRRLNYRFRNGQGEWRYIEAVARNLLHDPNVRGVVINFRDITERIEAEKALERYAQALAEAYDRTLEGWAKALELRDELTEDHTRRVVKMSVRFAHLLGIDESQLVHIRRGAILHDIGKMAIPDSILRKHGALTAEERRIVERHPQVAYDMLFPIEFLRPALDIPYAHHERWDGKGYPRGLKGEAIPLAARIFSIVDVWDALTSDRPYRRAWSRERTLEYLRSQAGKMFDPTLVEFFIQHLDEIIETQKNGLSNS
ncbi:MAG: HD domain-containing phosphohydrolase [Anaerolineales bacterium]